MKEFILELQNYFAIDYDILPARQWWDNNLAYNNINELKELINKIFINKECHIRVAFHDNKDRLMTFLNINKELQKLTENYLDFGKVILHQEYLRENQTIPLILKENINDLLKFQLELVRQINIKHSYLMNNLDLINVKSEIMRQNLLNKFQDLDSNITNEVKNILNSRIMPELRMSESPSIRSNSPILNELQKLPNRFY